MTQSFRPHYGPGVDSASNRNQYQEYLLGWGKGGLCVKLTSLPPSCANFLEILGASSSWRSKGLATLCRDGVTFFTLVWLHDVA